MSTQAQKTKFPQTIYITREDPEQYLIAYENISDTAESEPRIVATYVFQEIQDVAAVAQVTNRRKQ